MQHTQHVDAVWRDTLNILCCAHLLMLEHSGLQITFESEVFVFV